MNLLGFTGTRSTAPAMVLLERYFECAEFLMYADAFDGFVTGGCKGFDAYIGKLMALKFPGKKHVVVVPANRSQVDPWWEKFDHCFITVIEMPEGSTYKKRNQKIVELSGHLFYCADYPEAHGKSTRSGTWQTFRLAKDAGMTPDGIIIHKEEANA